MLDIETYNLTRHLSDGPLLVMKDLPADELPDEPVTTGLLIGRILSLAVVIALGVYSYFLF